MVDQTTKIYIRIRERYVLSKNKEDEVWEDEKGKIISTQGPKKLDKLLKKIKRYFKHMERIWLQTFYWRWIM